MGQTSTGGKAGAHLQGSALVGLAAAALLRKALRVVVVLAVVKVVVEQLAVPVHIPAKGRKWRQRFEAAARARAGTVG